MRNMSFFLTTEQMRAGTKTVTRRLGWADLKPGEHFMAVEKGQGIPKGGKVVRIRECVCVSNHPERLDDIGSYGQSEVMREGFPEMSPVQFVEMFCQHNRCTPDRVVNRIKFRNV